MTNNDKLMARFDEILAEIELFQRTSEKFIEYKNRGLTKNEIAIVLIQNGRIKINSPYFSRLIENRQQLARKISENYRRKKEAKKAYETTLEVILEDDETPEIEKNISVSYLNSNTCPSGYSSIIKINDLGDRVCDGNPVYSECGECEYNPGN